MSNSHYQLHSASDSCRYLLSASEVSDCASSGGSGFPLAKNGLMSKKFVRAGALIADSGSEIEVCIVYEDTRYFAFSFFSTCVEGIFD